jgi:hypothetical protein
MITELSPSASSGGLVPALPSSVLEPLWVQGGRAPGEPSGPPPAGLPPPPHPRPAGVRQAHPGPGVRRWRPPHRRRHLLGDHPAPPPRPVEQRRRGRAAPPGGAGHRRPHARPPAGAPGRDSCITKAPCGGQTAGPSPTDRRTQGRNRWLGTEAGGIPSGAVPAPANRRDDGLGAATLTPWRWSQGCPSGQWGTGRRL